MSHDARNQKVTITRMKVDWLLNEASDLKMMRYQTQEARKKIERAYKLSKDNRLKQPWPSLCAYRLGHLIMRTASDAESLYDAEAYFLEATRSKSLGPLPALYRLSVLHRLEKANLAVGNDRIRDAIKEAEKAIQESNIGKRTQIQDHLFNLIELAAYFIAMDYAEVEGMGEYHDVKNPPPSWILVGPNPQMAEVKYSEAYALEELEGMIESHPGAVFFVLRSLTSPKTGNRPRAQWKIGQNEWGKTSYPELKLLALLLRQNSHSLKGLAYQFLGTSEFTFGAFNQNKFRLKRDIAKLMNRKETDIVVETTEGLPIICPDIEIYGAVEESALYYNDRYE